MAKYRKKPVVIEATRWFKNGDHPLDDIKMFVSVITGERFAGEGKIIRYYRSPKMDGKSRCKYCRNIMNNHGWIDTLEGGHIVCPGDYVITGVLGEYYPCKPDIFDMTYESVAEEDRE